MLDKFINDFAYCISKGLSWLITLDLIVGMHIQQLIFQYTSLLLKYQVSTSSQACCDAYTLLACHALKQDE